MKAFSIKTSNTTYTIKVDGERVWMVNDAGVLCCLSNVGFMMNENGTAAKKAAILAAAKSKYPRTALRSVTGLNWMAA